MKWFFSAFSAGVIAILFETNTALAQKDINNSSLIQQERSEIYGSGWFASHADGGNTDFSPINGPRNITLAWQRKFTGTINLGPTCNDKGVVYVTTSGEGCHLFALDHKTGATIWCSDKVNRFAVASSALLDYEGRIFIADNEAMHAFDSTGMLLWETPIDGFPFSAQFTQTGRLIFITCIGKIYVLNRVTGENILSPIELVPNYRYDKNMDVRACMRGTKDCPCANTLAFDSYTGRFYFTFWIPGTKQASLMAMQYSENPNPSIVTIWINNSLPGGSATSPDISFDGTKIYVNDNVGGLHALSAQTGKDIWTFNIGYEPGGSQSTSPEGLIMPAGGGNAGLMCIADKGAYAEMFWRNDSLQNRGIATQSCCNLAYVTVRTDQLKNDLVVIDVCSGAEVDREHLPGKTIFTVGTTIGSDGNIYVPTFIGQLFAFRPDYGITKNKRLLWK
ncbi:MAG TPA: PQQ-binding-like beta-propeller repeat protein [Bacteroidales bacterium]|nr:PQQ-binding-like beta-propeller repeat protein [Bacteroidales bacterium]